MTRLSRSDVERLAADWRDLPEDSRGAPILLVAVTPASLAALMDLFGIAEVEGTVQPGQEALLSSALQPASDGPRRPETVATPSGVEGILMRRSGPR